jgi:hypothetical protein
MPQTPTQSQEIGNYSNATRNTAMNQVQCDPNDSSHRLEYPKIDLQSHEIRILYLLPGNRDDPLRCILRAQSLDANHTYEALSYVWGDPLDVRPIEVNGREKDVTINLFNALRKLRYSQSQRCLWVDALCIDQENDIEKSHQVRLMSKIYSRTIRAILWLSDFCDTANETTNYITCDAARAAFSLIELLANSPHGCVSNDKNKNLIDDGYVGLSRLLQLPWWHRAWTVQETVLPSDAILVCGTVQLSFSSFRTAYHNSIHHHFRTCCDKMTVPETFWNHMHALIYVRISLEEHTMFIGDAFNLFRNRHASDLRDKMYAYIGLGSDILPDYSLPHEQVFKLGTRSLIESQGTLESLLRTAEEERNPTLPSWCPDWSADINNQNYDYEMGWYYLHQLYTAGGEEKPRIGASHSEDILNLWGVILERVKSVGGVMDSVDDMREMVVKWQSGPNDEYPQGGTYAEASWRTLICDVSQGQGSYKRLEIGDNGEAIVNGELRQNLAGSNTSALGRNGFFTETGLIGLGNPDIQVGDFIAIFQGGSMPYILRQVKVEEGNIYYQFIGQVYIHGIMDGEILEKGLEFEWISLV